MAHPLCCFKSSIYSEKRADISLLTVHIIEPLKSYPFQELTYQYICYIRYRKQQTHENDDKNHQRY